MVRPRGKKFMADVTVGGVRKRITFDTMGEARAFESSATKGLPLIHSLAFKRFHEENFKYLWGDNKAPIASLHALHALDKFIPAWTLITDIKTPFIMGVIAKMQKAHASNATINRRLSALSRLLRHAERLEIIPKRPHIEFLKEPHGRERVLSSSEEKSMDKYFKHMGLEKSWALSFFLLYTGCRLGEALSLTRDRVDGHRVTFHYSLTKNSKTRVVPLVGPALDAWYLVCGLSEDERPFGSLSRNTYRGHWMRFKTHMGLWDDDEFVPHMLRHTCASRLVSKGVPLPQVMLWMGHTSMQTTLRYSHLAPEDLVKAAEALWPD